MPYVFAELKYAKEKRAATLSICNVENSKLVEYFLVVINPIAGTEGISGSTRMRAGTSRKMVLNMLSTATMIQLGKTYGNLMIDTIATNNKLRKRAIRIVTRVARIDEGTAADTGLGASKTVVRLIGFDDLVIVGNISRHFNENRSFLSHTRYNRCKSGLCRRLRMQRRDNCHSRDRLYLTRGMETDKWPA